MSRFLCRLLAVPLLILFVGPVHAEELRPTAHIEHPDIGECSGIVWLNGRFWVHNDSGDQPRLFANAELDFRQAGTLPVVGATANDWEDLAVMGEDLLVCDIGDNGRQRDDLTLYRVRPEASGEAVRLVESYPIAYPDGRHDAEAAFVVDGAVIIVTKDRGEGTGVYQFPALKTVAALEPGQRNVGVRTGTLHLGTGEQVTGGDVHPETGRVALLTYTQVAQYQADKLDGEPLKSTRIGARQCEAICFQGDDLVIANEQRDVFRLQGFLKEAPEELLPPLGQAELPRVAAEEGVDRFDALAASVPLQDLAEGGSFRWLLEGDRLRARIRLVCPSPTPTPADSPRLGSALLIGFSRQDSSHFTGEETILALGVDDEGQAVCYGLDPENLLTRIPAPATATVTGGLREGALELGLELDVTDILPRDGAEVRVQIVGFRLQGEPEPSLSGLDLYTLFRPYLWGRVAIVPAPDQEK